MVEANPYQSPEKRTADATAPRKPLTAGAMVGVAFLTALSAAIAFCCTCFPLGLMTFELHRPPPGPGKVPGLWADVKPILPWAVGALAAALVGFLVARRLTRKWTTP